MSHWSLLNARKSFKSRPKYKLPSSKQPFSKILNSDAMLWEWKAPSFLEAIVALRFRYFTKTCMNFWRSISSQVSRTTWLGDSRSKSCKPCVSSKKIALYTATWSRRISCSRRKGKVASGWLMWEVGALKIGKSTLIFKADFIELPRSFSEFAILLPLTCGVLAVFWSNCSQVFPFSLAKVRTSKSYFSWRR